MVESPETDKPTLKRRIPVPFFLNLPATTNQGLSSDRITFPYKVVKVQAHFRDDANNNLQVWCYVARNNNVGTAPPPDNKILGFYSPTPYLIGEGEIVAVDTDVIPDKQEQFLKVFFCNFNAYAMTGYCVITIETLEGLSDEELASLSIGADERKYTYQEWLAIGQKMAKALAIQANDIQTGTSETYINEVVTGKATTAKTAQGLYPKWQDLSAFFDEIPPASVEGDILGYVGRWAQKIVDMSFEANNNQYWVDLITSVLHGKAFNFVDWLESIYGLQGNVKRLYSVGVETALVPWVERYYNSLYVPKLPSESELINMVVKEKMTLDGFKIWMRASGYKEEWSQLIWDAHFIAPDFDSVKRAFWRKAIKMEDMPNYMKRVDLDPYYNDTVWFPLLQEIPQYMDLINMRVKEVIDQQTFKDALESHGYYGDWAERLWDAHFSPATFTDFLTAMRRKRTVTIPKAEGTPVSYTFGDDTGRDIDTIKELSILADYDPRYWSFFKERIYGDPSPRMSMWAYETGVIPQETLRDVVHRYGYTPETEEWFGDMLVHFQERPWITRYLTALQTAYIEDAITADELKARVKAIPRNEEIANWMIKIADVRKEVKGSSASGESSQLLGISDLKKAYMFGFLDEDNLRVKLLDRGFTLLDVDLLIQVMNKEHDIEDEGGKKTGLTTTELFSAWRYGELSEDDLKTKLMVKGLNLDEVNILIETKKKMWDIGNVETVG